MITIDGEKTITEWEREKMLSLISECSKFFGYNFLREETVGGVNEHSGYTWIWNEDFATSFYYPISCELDIADLYCLYSCPVDGEEIERSLFDCKNKEGYERFVKVCQYLTERKER